MEDKEVGELWRLAKDAKPSPSDDLVTIRHLIRKLVEERSKRCPNFTSAAICESFGIDPETFK